MAAGPRFTVQARKRREPPSRNQSAATRKELQVRDCDRYIRKHHVSRRFHGRQPLGEPRRVISLSPTTYADRLPGLRVHVPSGEAHRIALAAHPNPVALQTPLRSGSRIRSVLPVVRTFGGRDVSGCRNRVWQLGNRSITGPGQFNFDMSIIKSTKIWEHGTWNFTSIRLTSSTTHNSTRRRQRR